MESLRLTEDSKDALGEADLVLADAVVQPKIVKPDVRDVELHPHFEPAFFGVVHSVLVSLFYEPSVRTFPVPDGLRKGLDVAFQNGGGAVGCSDQLILDSDEWRNWKRFRKIKYGTKKFQQEKSKHNNRAWGGVLSRFLIQLQIEQDIIQVSSSLIRILNFQVKK